MKTEVVVKRPFMGSEVKQRSKTEMFSATDLVKIGNTKRRELGKSEFQLSAFLNQKSTKEFIEELQKTNERVVIKGRGRSANTWVHPLLFIDIALSINPKFKVEVYSWLYDQLIKHRNESGESYKKMAGSLYHIQSNKAEFPRFITKVADYIRERAGVKDWNTASETQLELRNKMHENIALLSDVLRDPRQAVRIGVEKALKEYSGSEKEV